MRPYLTFVTLALLLLAPNALAQKEMTDVYRGNKDYKAEKFEDAELDYRRSIDKNKKSFQAYYNLGNALFRQEKYAEAATAYAEAANLLDQKDKRNNERLSQTYHNLGNACFAQEQYDKAVAAYMESLRRNPKDDETRYNLVKAMEKLKEQQSQQNQQQDRKDQQQQQQQQQEEQQQEPEQEQQEQQEQQMDKQTAEQILQALEQDEQETQEKLKRQQGSKRRVEKDW